MSSQFPVQFTVRLVNKLPMARTVILEPWTGEYDLAPASILEIVVEGTPRTPLEVELEGDRIIINAFDIRTRSSPLTAMAVSSSRSTSRLLASEALQPAAASPSERALARRQPKARELVSVMPQLDDHDAVRLP